MNHMRVILPILSVMAVLFAGCDTQSSAVAPQPTQLSVHTGFPAFSDYRAAYVDKQGYIHAVTLDGKTDLKGLQLPNLAGPVGFSVGQEGTSADGQYIAFSSTAPKGSPVLFSFVDLRSTTCLLYTSPSPRD